MKGQKISHYKVLKKIGAGGMGQVYLAEDTKLKRRVALKFLSAGLIDDRRARERFEREAQAAAALNNPHIVTIHEINQHEGHFFIAMEYIAGRTLGELIDASAGRNQTLPIPDTIAIAIQIGQGLQAAHQKGIIHRDIKPANVIIGRDKMVKILDFGMAKLRDVSRLTGEFVAAGTLAYMSPEQLNGKDLDPRSDIWSLGVVLYEMYSGRLPFRGRNPQAMIHSILNKEPPPIATLETGKDLRLATIILQMLEKDRAVRLPSCESLVTQLKEMLALGSEKSMSRVDIKTSAPITIAVMPFVDMSPNKDHEYFCDGMAEELIGILNKIEGLKVTPRTSSFQFKNKSYGLVDINKKLKADVILEGGVRLNGKRLRIDVRLIKVEDGAPWWSERFDRELKDVFAVQDDIAQAVADNLQVRLLSREQLALARRHSSDLEAYTLFLKGRYFWNKRYEGGMKRSIEFFQECIARDPGYALPYVGIADSLNILGLHGFLPPKQAFGKAKEAVAKALAIDSRLSAAHSSQGWISTFYDWNWERAEDEYRQAIRLDRGYATAHAWYALFLALMGRFPEAMAEIRLALELDPLSLIINSILGVILIFARRFEQARDQLSKTLEIDADFMLALIWLAETHLFTGHPDQAIQEFQRALRVDPAMTYALAGLGWAQALAGQTNSARETLERFQEISQTRYVSRVHWAQVHLGLGEIERVFELYTDAYALRDPFLLWLKIAPHFDRLRPEPRFQEMLGRMGMDG